MVNNSHFCKPTLTLEDKSSRNIVPKVQNTPFLVIPHMKTSTGCDAILFSARYPQRSTQGNTRSSLGALLGKLKKVLVGTTKPDRLLNSKPPCLANFAQAFSR